MQTSNIPISASTYMSIELRHPFNVLFSRTTWVSQYQKCKTCLDLNEARDNGVLGWQWHQLENMQTVHLHLAPYMRVNMNKTKVMISGERQMVRQKDVRWPWGVCNKGVGSNSLQLPEMGT